MNPVAQSSAFAFLLGVAALAIVQLVAWYKMRPRKLHMRDYYDAYYEHCSGCRMDT